MVVVVLVLEVVCVCVGGGAAKRRGWEVHILVMGRPGVLLDSQFGARAVKASLLSSLGKCGGLPSMCFFKCEGVRVPS